MQVITRSATFGVIPVTHRSLPLTAGGFFIGETPLREILTILLLAALLTVALKVALILLILAGFIFRTRETVGLIAILVIFAGFRTYPGIGFTIVAVIVAIAVYRSVSEQPEPD